MISHSELGLIPHLFRDPFVAPLHPKRNKQAPIATNKTAVNNSFYADFDLLGKDWGNGGYRCRPRCLSFFLAFRSIGLPYLATMHNSISITPQMVVCCFPNLLPVYSCDPLYRCISSCHQSVSFYVIFLLC